MGSKELQELKDRIRALTPEERRIALSCISSDELCTELRTRFGEYEGMLLDVKRAITALDDERA